MRVAMAFGERRALQTCPGRERWSVDLGSHARLGRRRNEPTNLDMAKSSERVAAYGGRGKRKVN